MHKVEDTYFRNERDIEHELNLFEPECIITDNPSSIADGDAELWAKSDNSYVNMFESGNSNISQNIFFSATNFDPSIMNSETIAALRESYSTADERMVNLELLQMHSIFTPEKRSKPKEVFTKCNYCDKFVIIRMCPETGDYTRCKYCLNAPLNGEGADFICNSEQTSKIVPRPSKKEILSNSRSESSFKCDHCGKLFTRNWYLKQHIKLHSNEKPYACNHCEKRFLNSSNLKQHLKTHSVEYRCCLCDKTYINIESLRLHAQKHAVDSSQDFPFKNYSFIYNDRNSRFIECKDESNRTVDEMSFQYNKCDEDSDSHGTSSDRKTLHENLGNV